MSVFISEGIWSEEYCKQYIYPSNTISIRVKNKIIPWLILFILLLNKILTIMSFKFFGINPLYFFQIFSHFIPWGFQYSSIGSMCGRISLVRTGGRIPIRFKKSTRSSSALAFRVIFTYPEHYQILHLQAKYSSLSDMIFNII